MNRKTTRVLIAGGGVAALEAAIALRELAPDLVEVELLSPDEYFSYRPLAVTLPFDDANVVRFDLAELAGALGASVTRGGLTGIDAWRHVAHASGSRELEYDVLLIACGAVPMPSIQGAVTFRGGPDAGLVRGVLDEIAGRRTRSVAFVVPWGPAWPIPAYDLALLANAHVEGGAEVWVVTPESEPLQLFGPPASAAVRELFAARGIGLRTGADAEGVSDGRLALTPDPPLDVDRVVALPRLVGAPLDGIPQTVDGFIPVDDHGCLHGLPDVYAAGDITSFPVKHGGLATQQALAAAEMIAANAGAEVEPRPFRPVVHGLLLTGSEPRFLRRDLHGRTEDRPVATTEPLWWPPAKIAGRYLGPFLAERVGGSQPSGETPDRKGLSIQIALESDDLADIPVGPVPTDFDEEDEDSERAVSSRTLELVAPEDTLGEVAERMLRDELTAVLVAEYGRLIGILTTHDLMSSAAARAHPGEARVRQWMTAEPVTMPADSSRSAAMRVMRAYGIHHLPLVDEGRPVDMLHLDLDDASPVVAVGLGF